MRILTSPKTLHQISTQLRAKKKRIGFVPTMGALHEGHASLLRRARRENDIVILSIFVNPLQFTPGEDLTRYPRPRKADQRLARRIGVDFLFCPSAREMYPPNFLTSIHTKRLDRYLCGRKRPGHFEGVTTVVAKLLNVVCPDVLYLGQKDAQQAIILRKMIADLNYFVTIKICPTVREKDGLALSSRNAYLSTDQRKKAPVLYQSLKYARGLVRGREQNASKIKQLMRTRIRRNGGKIDYIEIVDVASLEPVSRLKGKILIALAVYFGKARLIDNMILTVK